MRSNDSSLSNILSSLVSHVRRHVLLGRREITLLFVDSSPVISYSNKIDLEQYHRKKSSFYLDFLLRKNRFEEFLAEFGQLVLKYLKSSAFQGPPMIFQYFSRHKLFSRTFQDSPSFSSTFQACANPGYGCAKTSHCDGQFMIL